MNNLTIFFNFQSSRILNETLYADVKLLSETSDNGKEFREALTLFQKEVIRIWSFGKLNIVLQCLVF
jgi:IS30 family transposase